jgi:hypothetical protein
MSRPQISSAKAKAKAKAAVKKMKGAVTKAIPSSKESEHMKAKRMTFMGKDSKVEHHNPSCSAKSKADEKSGEDDIDRTGTQKSSAKAKASVNKRKGL